MLVAQRVCDLSYTAAEISRCKLLSRKTDRHNAVTRYWFIVSDVVYGSDRQRSALLTLKAHDKTTRQVAV